MVIDLLLQAKGSIKRLADSFNTLNDLCIEIQSKKLHSSLMTDLQVQTVIKLVKDNLNLFSDLSKMEIDDIPKELQLIIQFIVSFSRQYENAFIEIEGTGGKINLALRQIGDEFNNLVLILEEFRKSGIIE